MIFSQQHHASVSHHLLGAGDLPHPDVLLPLCLQSSGPLRRGSCAILIPFSSVIIIIVIWGLHWAPSCFWVQCRALQPESDGRRCDGQLGMSSWGHQGLLASLVCKCNSECDHCPMFVKMFNKSLLRKGPWVLHGCVDLKNESRTECSIQSWSLCRQCH